MAFAGKGAVSLQEGSATVLLGCTCAADAARAASLSY